MKLSLLFLKLLALQLFRHPETSFYYSILTVVRIFQGTLTGLSTVDLLVLTSLGQLIKQSGNTKEVYC